jgi:hypothetical protein
MTKAQRNPNVQAPSTKPRLRVALLLPALEVERLKTPKNTSIHVLKTFFISRSLSFSRGVASDGDFNIEVAGVEVVTIKNTDKYALVCVCACIFWGAIKKLQAPSSNIQRNSKLQAPMPKARARFRPVSLGFARLARGMDGMDCMD